MLGRLAVVVLIFSWLPDCKGEGTPATFEKFLSRGGLGSEEMCSAANDGKRFWVEGYLQLPSSLSISSGRTSLDFYARIDGNGRGSGRSISIDVTSPGNIDDLWASATGKKSVAYRSQQAQIDPDALRIRARNRTRPDQAQSRYRAEEPAQCAGQVSSHMLVPFCESREGVRGRRIVEGGC